MLDNQTIVVKCPHCSNKLNIRLRSNTMPESLTCPVCKQKSPFSAFKMAAAAASTPARSQGGETDLLVGGNRGYAGGQQPAYNQPASRGFDTHETELLGGAMGGVRSAAMGAAATGEETRFDGALPASQLSCGKLVFLSGNIPAAQLHEGRNIIGREATTSSADIRLPRSFDRISREHLIINVKRVGAEYKHEVQLYKREVNVTMLNAITLSGGDVYLLNDGDTIKLPDLTLRFEK